MRLNEQVTRNLRRFPSDFMFLTSFQEFKDLISQNAISTSLHGGRRKPLALVHGRNHRRLIAPLVARGYSRIQRYLSSVADLIEYSVRGHRRIAGKASIYERGVDSSLQADQTRLD